MDMNNKMAENLEAMDPIDMIEKTMGKSVDDMTEDEKTTMLGMVFGLNYMRNEMQNKIPDTNMSSPMALYEEILSESGFQKAYEKTRISKYGTEELDAIWVNPNGLVVYLESYNTTRLNNITLIGEAYCNVGTEEGYSLLNRMAMGGGSFGFFVNSGDDPRNKNLRGSFSIDCRTGFRRKLGYIKEFGTPIPQWEEDYKFLWFLNYDEHSEDDHRKITFSKVKESGNSILMRIMRKYLDEYDASTKEDEDKKLD